MSRLINLLDANTFNTYKDLYLYTDTQKIHYEIIGFKIIEKANNYHMTINFYDDITYNCIEEGSKLMSCSSDKPLYDKTLLLFN